MNKEMGFIDISRVILNAYDKFNEAPKSIGDVFAIDKEVRDFIRSGS